MLIGHVSVDQGGLTNQMSPDVDRLMKFGVKFLYLNLFV